MAHGLADDLLTTVLLATRAPVVVAPAMNVHMWENPLVRANLDRLRQAGVRVVEPGAGFLACGYEGKGRLADVEELVATVRAALTPADLAGERVLVTAGPNREAIDPVRFVSNRSTGKMGFAVAAAAARHGAEVTLVAGPVSLPTPPGVRRVDVVTAAEMLAAVEAEIEAAGVLVMTAAVADYRPAEVARDKIKKGKGGLTVEMVRNPDILATLTPRKGSRLFVGFAAETADVLANAARKLADKRLDLMVANDVARADAGFASDDNAVTILDAGGGREEVSLRPKEEVAEAIVARIAALRRPA
jgi:phosphopantothenoylcysteine decarboxylase/phosphopantothenate--cysteine ligase